MLRTEEQIKKMAAVAGLVLLATAEALGQENSESSKRRIVVSIPDHKLAIVESGHVVKIFATATGAERTPSPTGSFRVIQRIANPTWYGKGKVVRPGPANPLGTRWLGLSVKGYGIHGTNRPSSIGHSASHGCIRMRNRDVEELFAMVSVGDAVELFGARTPEVEQVFGTTSTAQGDAAAGQ